MTTKLEDLDPKDYIIIKEAWTNNLKGVSLAIKKNSLTVITGLSGSGKSSLAFDTIYSEGRRMYIESLSSYARQFLGKFEKPPVKQILGLAPTIAIEQKKGTFNSRSTIGTVTEIYEYLKLIFARIGTTYSPINGEIVTKDTVESVTNIVCSYDLGAKLMILFPIKLKNREEDLKRESSKGFSRVVIEGEVFYIDDLLKDTVALSKLPLDIYILVDRFIIPDDISTIQSRVADSIQTAFFESDGICSVLNLKDGIKTYSNKFERDGMVFEEPTVSFFGFNNPQGACDFCKGTGVAVGLDKEKIIPNKSLSVYENAVMPWRTESMHSWQERFIDSSKKIGFPIFKPYEELSDSEKALLWNGNRDVKGIYDFFSFIESKIYQIPYRVIFSKYKGAITCEKCRGSRVREDAAYVKIGGKSIIDLLLMTIEELKFFFDNLILDDYKQKIANRLIIEIRSRLSYLEKVGLGYLGINRDAPSLSGGEYQRVMLANSLGSTLVGSIYVLDEPTIGLHPRDTAILAEVLRNLQRIGNTVIVVEHEEDVMKIADEIIDIGPESGYLGGEVVFQGDWNALRDFSGQSHTTKYLKGISKIEFPAKRTAFDKFISIENCLENNLKGITVSIPLESFTVITGVSGSGKSTLVKKLLYPALANALDVYTERPGKFTGLGGDYEDIDFVDFVSQNPIGKSSKSNPISYLKIYDHIRALFSKTPLAIERGYDAGYFSYNVESGRCPDCEGNGELNIDMQFMADISVKCETCDGKRFKDEVLEVLYCEKNIFDVLNLTVDEAIEFFSNESSIVNRLKPLLDVGLGYVRLGQSTSTLSGGEAQRLKIAFYLSKNHSYKHIFFIFDEPTTGLHFHDVKKLISALRALVEVGHTVVVVEHNMELAKCADYIVDLGPDSGNRGGELIFAGTPEEMVKNCNQGFTYKYLQEKFK